MDKSACRLKYALLSATMLIGSAGLALALAQPAPAGNPEQTQMPEIKGNVAQYSLTPRGDVDGLILTDGTEVNLPPHASTQAPALGAQQSASVMTAPTSRRMSPYGPFLPFAAPQRYV